jgi:hypothetical protein
MRSSVGLDHFGLGFRNVANVCAGYALALVMHLQHDSSGIGFRLAKELHQYQNDEFHRRVVIIVQNYTVATSPFGYALMLNFNVDFSVSAPVRVLFGLSHNGRTNFAIE